MPSTGPPTASAGSPGLTYGDRTWTFAELRDEVESVASGLHATGVRPGDVVAVWLPNRPEWIFTFFAVTKLRAVILPINTSFRADDCRYVLEHSECSTLILTDRSGPFSYTEVLETMMPDLDQQEPGAVHLKGFPDLRRIVSVTVDATPRGCIEWSAVLEAADAPTPTATDPNAIASVMYTSGTSGRPKGVLHSHHALRNVTDQANRLNVRETDVILTVDSTSTTSAATGSTGSCSTGRP